MDGWMQGKIQTMCLVWSVPDCTLTQEIRQPAYQLDSSYEYLAMSSL